MCSNPVVALEATGGMVRRYKKKAATRISDGPRYVTARYHNTDIITIDKVSDTVILNSGGYRTLTTKKRMNEVMEDFGISVRVFQRKYDWFVRVSGNAVVHYPGIGYNHEVFGSEVVPFRDHMEIVFV